MIAETYNLNINIEKIVEEIEPLVRTYTAVNAYPGYGGWSVTSTSGSYKDGWNNEAVVLNEEKSMMDVTETFRNFSKLKLTKDAEHVLPTEFCSPEITKSVTKLSELGLSPCRARLHYLKAKSELYWHADAPEHLYAVRLHIPLITNEKCFFETREEKFHMPADGNGYFVNVAQIHRAVNGGATDRLHLVVTVKDTKNITKSHRWMEDPIKNF